MSIAGPEKSPLQKWSVDPEPTLWTLAQVYLDANLDILK